LLYNSKAIGMLSPLPYKFNCGRAAIHMTKIQICGLCNSLILWNVQNRTYIMIMCTKSIQKTLGMFVFGTPKCETQNHP